MHPASEPARWRRRRVNEFATDKAQAWRSLKEKCRGLKQAAQLSGITEKTAVVHAGLEALVARESAKRLAALGGSEPRLRKIRRRRPQASMASR